MDEKFKEMSSCVVVAVIAGNLNSDQLLCPTQYTID